MSVKIKKYGLIKKTICFLMSLIFVFQSMGVVIFADSSEIKAEKSFFEDFEKYNLIDDSDKSRYTNNAASVSDVITCGKPTDNDYSNTDIYPFGEASVYEGNAANNEEMFVYDAKGNKVFGGLDGWYGYYNGGAQQYNLWNRRLSVYNKHSEGETNQSQYLNINLSDSTTTTASFSRNNVAIDGYSYFSFRINLKNAEEKIFNKAGLKLTVNPVNNTEDAYVDLLYFTDSKEEDMLDVYLNGAKVGTILKSISGQWYTVDLRMYNGNSFLMDKVKIVNELNNECCVNTQWQRVPLFNTQWEREASTKVESLHKESASNYGFKFYASSVKDSARPIVKLDDIFFTNEGFKEDFEKYNTKKYYNPETEMKKFVTNGIGGDTNLDVYKTYGEFEGNMAINNYVFKTLSSSYTSYKELTRVYGNVPFWQGYLSNLVSGKNIYQTDIWKDSCTIISADERYEAKYAFGEKQKSLIMFPRTSADITSAQHVYAGMESADFSDISTLKFKINLYNANTTNDIFKLQLTNGRSTAKNYPVDATNGELSYDGNSHKAYLDVLTLKSGKIYLGNNLSQDVASYLNKTNYAVEYTVDLYSQTPKHYIKITDIKNDTVILSKEFSASNENFDFYNSITGFRFEASTPDGTSETLVENKVLIDDVELLKKLNEKATGAPDEVNLTVDTNTVLKDVGREMYGVNFEWGGYGNYYVNIYDDNISNGFDNTKLSKLNPSVLETNSSFTDAFKGTLPIARMAGVSANYMLWKEAIGSWQNRSELDFWHYDPMRINFGPVEWINTIKATDENSKFIYTVNMPRERNNEYDKYDVMVPENKQDQIDTIENLKDLVRFMTLNPDDEKAIGSDGINWAQKRVDLGIENPVDIYAWELGCELDTDGQGRYSITQYVDMCKNAIDAILSIDPDAKISAHERTSILYSESHTRNWHNTLFSEIGDKIDYLSVHYYYSPTEFDMFKTYYNNLLEDINNCALTKDRLKILLTEHSGGRISSETSAGYNYMLPHTMRGALSTAKHFIDFMSMPKIKAATYHSINSSSWSLIYPNGNAFEKTAPGIVREMFAKKGYGKSVKCEFTDYDAQNAPLKISSGAIKTDNGINLFIVNSSNFEDTVVNLNLNSDYKLKNKTVISADDYASDKYTGVNEISFLDVSFNQSIDECVVYANSIVLLEFEKQNLLINSCDLSKGKVEYTTDFCEATSGNLACAIYKGKELIDVKLLPNQNDLESKNDFFTFENMPTDITSVKLFAFKNDYTMPLCDVFEYNIKD